MFFRVVKRKHGDEQYDYLCLVESYREEGKPRQRLLHSFGNIGHIPDQKRRELLTSLQRALGFEDPAAPQLSALDALHFGDLLALRKL